MDPILAPGDFYGQKHRHFKIAGATFTEMVYFPAFKIPRHSHEGAFFGLVLEGAYTETYERRNRECKPATFLFHPEGEVHSETHYDVVVRIFNVEPASLFLDPVRKRSYLLDQPLAFEGGPELPLTLRLYHEFRDPDALTPIAMEGLLLELLATTCRGSIGARDPKPPRWLRQVRDLLQEKFTAPPSLQDMARIVGFKNLSHPEIGERR